MIARLPNSAQKVPPPGVLARRWDAYNRRSSYYLLASRTDRVFIAVRMVSYLTIFRQFDDHAVRVQEIHQLFAANARGHIFVAGHFLGLRKESHPGTQKLFVCFHNVAHNQREVPHSDGIRTAVFGKLFTRWENILDQFQACVAAFRLHEDNPGPELLPPNPDQAGNPFSADDRIQAGVHPEPRVKRHRSVHVGYDDIYVIDLHAETPGCIYPVFLSPAAMPLMVRTITSRRGCASAACGSGMARSRRSISTWT